ncbi:MAG: 4Fe-4S ferredoxin [Deltaproteobacteria bacterium]|nr:4Fe-4S ferredoxin [Deltaproteobacteria bacterium]
MKVMRKIIEIDEDLCDGCGQCVPGCAEGALDIVDGKARMVSETFCDGLGACLGECPTGALKIVEREAEDFDEEAVEAFLKEKEKQPEISPDKPFQCPSTRLQTFIPPAPGAQRPRTNSALTHWPVQINLVPPTAPFLKEAHLLVAADCVPVAYANFHQDFLQGKVLMIGCPKFDDVPEYIQKFTDIFNTVDIKKITVVVMEVPCCSGLPAIIRKAMDASGKAIPLEEVVIGTQGEILKNG